MDTVDLLFLSDSFFTMVGVIGTGAIVYMSIMKNKLKCRGESKCDMEEIRTRRDFNFSRGTYEVVHTSCKTCGACFKRTFK